MHASLRYRVSSPEHRNYFLKLSQEEIRHRKPQVLELRPERWACDAKSWTVHIGRSSIGAKDKFTGRLNGRTRPDIKTPWQNRSQKEGEKIRKVWLDDTYRKQKPGFLVWTLYCLSSPVCEFIIRHAPFPLVLWEHETPLFSLGTLCLPSFGTQ